MSVQIVNQALTLLGEASITSLTDNSQRARVMNTLFEPTRDALLAGHPWVFARSRVTLAQEATAPPFGWAGSFQLPNDFLRLLATNVSTWEIEGTSLLTDEGPPVEIEYIRRVTTYAPLFERALAALLAREAAMALTGQPGKFDRADRLYKEALAEARSANAIQLPGQVLTADSYYQARF